MGKFTPGNQGDPCSMPTTQMGGKVPPPPGSPPGPQAYPSLRPSMGRGTRPPRSKAEVMLISWSSAGSQRPPKAMRKRLAGVEGSTSSTSWLRTRNSAWYGSRGPGRARWAAQAVPSPAQILPKPPPPSSSLNLPRPLPSFFTPRTPKPCPSQPQGLMASRAAKDTTPEAPQDALLPTSLPVFPSTPPLPGEIPHDWRWWGGVGGTFWVRDQEH